MLELHKRLAFAQTSGERDMYQRQTARPALLGVDVLVASRELYGLTDKEIKIVEGQA
jgi:hypothetical protein